VVKDSATVTVVVHTTPVVTVIELVAVMVFIGAAGVVVVVIVVVAVLINVAGGVERISFWQIVVASLARGGLSFRIGKHLSVKYLKQSRSVNRYVMALETYPLDRPEQESQPIDWPKGLS
jgi:hypothetical protein